MYSFDKDQAGLDAFYEKAIQAYKNVYRRVGIGDKTYLTFASGGMFSKYSHEFQTICEAGEDHVYIDDEKSIAVNDEVMQDEVLESLGIKRESLRKEKSIEVGNIFKYGNRYTKELGLVYKDENGKEIEVIIGAYGIGLGRVMGTIVELMSDEKGLVWPESVSPFKYHLLSLGKDEDIVKTADELYEDMAKQELRCFTMIVNSQQGKSLLTVTSWGSRSGLSSDVTLWRQTPSRWSIAQQAEL
jgi:prolyl-tRNA synthetase